MLAGSFRRSRTMTQDEFKKAVAKAAIAHVPEDCIVGVGTGSTANFFIDELARIKGRLEGAVASSEATAARLKAAGIRVFDLNSVDELPVYVDGADEITRHLHMIKGGGGALTREKIVAASSRRLIILVGEEKLVAQLGARGQLPVEITPFALPLCERRLSQLGCQPILYHKENVPFLTDNGNYILDCRINPISDALNLEMEIRSIPGVVGTGLFLGMADTVLVGHRESLRLIEERRRGPH